MASKFALEDKFERLRSLSGVQFIDETAKHFGIVIAQLDVEEIQNNILSIDGGKTYLLVENELKQPN